MPVSSGGIPYKPTTPGASPDNPIASISPAAAPTTLNPTGEPVPGTSSGVRAKLMQAEYNEKERINKKEQKELKEQKDKSEKETEKRRKAANKKYRQNAGVEIPKQGLHRFGYAEGEMTSEKGISGIQMEPGGGEGYSDAFGQGGFDLFGGGSGRGRKSAGAQMGVNFAKMGSMSTGLGGLNIGFGGLGNAMKSDGNARGFGGYRDPFGGSSMSPKLGKAKRGKAKKGRKPSLGGGSIFNLRLF